MEKIVITGGVGYIGSKLCELYSGEARYKDITVVDNRFSADRVKQLKAWGIKYIQASILDKDQITSIVQDADIVIHLAGITNVAYTKTEANSEQDNLITTTAIEGTKNIRSRSIINGYYFFKIIIVIKHFFNSINIIFWRT